MAFSRPVRTDLVISMTLAETFLLLLFVVWFGYTAIWRYDPLALLKEKINRLETENQALRKDFQQAKAQIADLQWRLNWWHSVFPGRTEVEGPGGPADAKLICQEACRSYPSCELGNNVLVQASVLRGRLSMSLVWLPPKLSGWLRSSGHTIPGTGVAIEDGTAIRGFLEAVRAYYRSAPSGGRECRFDYRLSYQSKEDYFDGREMFEAYFYPAGLHRVGGN
jgi:hypothetical protein